MSWIADENAARRVESVHRRAEHLAPEVELHHLMTSWRHRLDPQQIPGLVAAYSGRIRRTVSQEMMAQLVGVSPLWYGKLERGERDAKYSDSLLDRVAYSLRLNPDERRVLYLLAASHEPPVRPEVEPAAVSRPMEQVLEAQPWPAWVSGPGWQVLALNAASYHWFPHMRWETNVMRWVFAYPESRMQLVDWDTVWAPLMLAQMRAANARWADHEPLKQLIAETLEINEDARRMWKQQPVIHVHPDGDRRWLYLPHAETATQLELVAWTPMRNPDLRVVMLIPIGGYIPPACADSLSSSSAAATAATVRPASAEPSG